MGPAVMAATVGSEVLMPAVPAVMAAMVAAARA
jgi:hypothetical protein